MTAATLVADLRARGVALAVVDGQLSYRSPRGTLTPADRTALAAHKAEILAILSQELAEPPWRMRPVPEQLADAGTCPDCGGPMEPTPIVLPDGRAWWCGDRRSCGRVVYAADALSANDGGLER